MPPRLVIQVVVITTVAALLVLTAIHGKPNTLAGWLAPVGPATFAAYFGVLWFDTWGWRAPGVRKLTRRPVLHGTWQGSLHSLWIDPATGERIAPDPNVFLVVRQRFWSVTVRLITRESKSKSLMAALETGIDGVCQLHYLYQNVPRTEVRNRSDIHLGAVVIDVPQEVSGGLEGHYFADRHPSMTRGELRFRVHSPELIETYDAGVACFESLRS